MNIHAEFIKHEAEQDRACIEIQHMLNAVIGVVIQKLIEPLQGVFIWLTNTAEISSDGRRPAEVWVRAVGAFGVKRFHERRANDIQCGNNRGQISVRFGFLHLAHGNIPPRHKRFIRNRLLRHDANPREVLQGRDFERDSVLIHKLDLLRRFALNLEPVLCH